MALVQNFSEDVGPEIGPGQYLFNAGCAGTIP